MDEGCLACDLTSGERELPGGRIHASRHWVVEHCIGPLGLGSLIVKPVRHCLHVKDLQASEADELGPMLATVTRCVQELTDADQVYVCLWSHAGWEPVHIHFVVQPSWNHLQQMYTGAGPVLQAKMFEEGLLPSSEDVQDFCDRARSWSGWQMG